LVEILFFTSNSLWHVNFVLPCFSLRLRMNPEESRVRVSHHGRHHAFHPPMAWCCVSHTQRGLSTLIW
jgi:hypothetical protein